MDRLGCLLCYSNSSSSLNSVSMSDGVPSFVPSALHAQQQEQLATMRSSMTRIRSGQRSQGGSVSVDY